MLSKSTEKLSSGYRVNRAADDAAGLAISEKMRWQIRGLDKASKNIQDGISLIQVAEGALNETHSVLQRARELAVQAANDTNTSIDRSQIQLEIDQITQEVDRIATQTVFNGEIYPLNAGGMDSDNVDSDRLKVDENGKTWILPDSLIETKINYYVRPTDDITIDGKRYNAGETATLNVIGMRLKYNDLYGGEEYYSLASKNTSFLVHPFDTSEGDSGVINFKNDFSLTFGDLKVNSEGHAFFEDNGNIRFLFISDLNQSTGMLEASNSNPEALIASYPESFDWFKAEEYRNEKMILNIQSGSLSWQAIKLDLVDATAKGIGLKNVDVSSFESSGRAIDMLDNAIDKVSFYRARFGAQQNRLEHAMAIDDNTSENTSAAESRIRDTDMAKEMVVYSKNNILQQAGQSVLTQANQSTQGVLSVIG